MAIGEGGFEGGEALFDGHEHRIRKPRLNPRQAPLEPNSLGGDGCFQSGEAGVDGAGAVGEGAVVVIETAVEFVEAGVERVEDLLQGRLHGAASAIEPGVVVVVIWGWRKRGRRWCGFGQDWNETSDTRC